MTDWHKRDAITAGSVVRSGSTVLELFLAAGRSVAQQFVVDEAEFRMLERRWFIRATDGHEYFIPLRAFEDGEVLVDKP